MKRIVSLILAASLMAALVLSLTACGSGTKQPETQATEAATEPATEAATEPATEAATEAAAEAATEPAAEAPEVKSDAEEKTEADDKNAGEGTAGDVIVIEFEDFDAMEALSKSIQNGEKTGQAVEIDGISTQIGTKYSIGEKKDSTFKGTNYSFDGEYPADGAHVKLTGKVVGEGLVFTIEADSIEVIE